MCIRDRYAGYCYIIGQELDSAHEHHVGFLIDQGPGGHELQLRFSFFTPEQPYDELDVIGARAAFGEPALPLTLYDGYAYSDISERSFFSRYWFRHEARTGSILLVSYFGYRTTLLCDASANVVAMD